MVEPVFELANVGLRTILKDDAEFYVGLFRGFDKGLGARGSNFDRFFREHVQALTGGGNALSGVEAGGAAKDDEIHGAMLQKGVEGLIRSAAVFAAEAGDFFGVGAVHGGDFDAGDGEGGAGVGFRDVAAAYEADVGGHEKLSVIRF